MIGRAILASAILSGLVLLLASFGCPGPIWRPVRLTWTVIAGGGNHERRHIQRHRHDRPAGAGPAAGGGGYSLTGGVWGGAGAVTPPPGDKRVYLPVVIK